MIKKNAQIAQKATSGAFFLFININTYYKNYNSSETIFYIGINNNKPNSPRTRVYNKCSTHLLIFH